MDLVFNGSPVPIISGSASRNTPEESAEQMADYLLRT